MNIAWTSGATLSLRTIRQYIHADNPIAAQNVADRIKQAVAQLETFPHSGRPGLRAGTRELVIANLPYVVVYRVTDQVEILRVFHARQFRH